MMYRNTASPSWSRGGFFAAACALAQIAASTAAATQGWRIGSVTLALTAAGAIASVIVLARCLLPAALKAGLIAAVCATLLTMVATQDLMGLRAVERTTSAAVERDAVSNQPAPRTLAVTVTPADAAAAPAARALAADIDRRLPPDSDVTVAATMSQGAGGTRVSWTLVRGADRLWCGLHSESAAPGDNPFAALTDRVAAAAQRSQHGSLNCA